MNMEYFEQIKEIYQEIFPNRDANLSLRNLDLDEMIYFIGESCKNLSQLEHTSLHKRIEAMLRVGALIMLFQPFSDGNKHTASAFISSQLEQLGYFLPSEEILEERMIPIFYHPWEKIPRQKVLTVKKKMKNQSSSSRYSV